MTWGERLDELKQLGREIWEALPSDPERNKSKMNDNHDDEAIPMSEFKLGERYGSEDMYRDMGIRPGARVSVEIGGVLYTDTVQSITSTDAQPAIHPALNWWQRFRRQLTPRRWRKPIQPIWPAKPASITIEVGDTDEQAREPIERTQAILATTGTIIDGLIKSEPGEAK